MSSLAKVSIDLEEQFPHLTRAPIVEAVIDIRARAQGTWEESTIIERLKSQLPDYPSIQSQHATHHHFKIEAGQLAEQNYRDLGWKGLRFQSADNWHVAQFNQEGFSFSRLQPYDSWEQLSSEALRLWQFHLELAQPSDAQRLGLRFINKITVGLETFRIEDYLQVSPQPPQTLDLPFAGFFHQDTMVVPGHSYAINIIRTIQPPQAAVAEGPALILDIDVFTAQPFELRAGPLEQRLSEMRWLKNRAFFGCITQKALEAFR